ncbi:MAG: thiamine-phosphate kinase [Sphingopyxis sp.]
MNEGDFITALRAIAVDPAARGLADDCAALPDGAGGAIICTHDMMVAGTHFPLHAHPADVAWKLVGANLSVLAAKGARPIGVLLGYILGGNAWDRAFISGLADALAHYDTPLLGGDTVAAPAAGTGALSPHAPGHTQTATGQWATWAGRGLGLTALGRATHCPAPCRSGAQVGDIVYVTGVIGHAYYGFHLDSTGQSARHAGDAAALARFRRPEPRVAHGMALAPHVTSMMDISDGLLLDATRLAIASGKTLSLDRARVPVPPTMPAELLPRSISWGDDYELLFTLPAGVPCPVPATAIGHVLAPGAHPMLVDGTPPESTQQLGWQHDGPG